MTLKLGDKVRVNQARYIAALEAVGLFQPTIVMSNNAVDPRRHRPNTERILKDDEVLTVSYILNRNSICLLRLTAHDNASILITADMVNKISNIELLSQVDCDETRNS